MSSENKTKKLHKVFEQLLPLDRKLMALKIICAEYVSGWYNPEKKFIDFLIKSDVMDGPENILSHKSYSASADRLQALDLAEKNANLIIHEHLENNFLAWMPEVELDDVFSIVDLLYPPDSNNDKYLLEGKENPEKARVHILKALYTNKTDYFKAPEKKFVIRMQKILY
jgi:hypothetical protein